MVKKVSEDAKEMAQCNKTIHEVVQKKIKASNTNHKKEWIENIEKIHSTLEI